MAALSVGGVRCQRSPSADHGVATPFLRADRKHHLSRLSCERRLPAYEFYVPLLYACNSLPARHVRSLADAYDHGSDAGLDPPGHSAVRGLRDPVAIDAVACGCLPRQVERPRVDRVPSA